RPGAPGGRCRGDRPMTDDARTNGARAGEPEEARDRPADAAPSGDPATLLRSRSVWARLYHGETTGDLVRRCGIWCRLAEAAVAAPSGDPAAFLRPRSVWARLYHGETTVDFVGRWRIWFGLSAAVILVGVVAFVVRGGFNLGIDFEGGVVWQVPTEDVTVAEA